jgi:HK97 family phage prohead protease
VRDADLPAFRRTYGVVGDKERRVVPLERVKMTNTGNGDGRLKVIGHAAVFNSPSVEMRGPVGSFIERIHPRAFDNVLRRNPDVVLTWDHNTLYPLARTSAGTLELSVNSHGLRYFATCSPTSYAEDLRTLMKDGVVSESSFTFRVAPGGEDWQLEDGIVTRTIHEIGDLYDVCVCVAGAYPATDSGIARKLYVDYATSRGLLNQHPDAAARIARAKAELDLRRRRADLCD